MGATLGLPDLPGTTHETVQVMMPLIAAGADAERAIWRAPKPCRISNIYVTWHAAIVGGADKFAGYVNKISAAGAAVWGFGSRAHTAGLDETANVPRNIPNAVNMDMVAGEVVTYLSDQIGAGLDDPSRVVQFDVQWT